MFFQTIIQHTHSLITKTHAGADKPLIILGLSGGPDSVFLFFVLLELRKKDLIEFIAAHLDHGWRETSAQDAAFCMELCKKNNVKIITEHAQNLNMVKDTGSREDVGRRLRRQFFERIKQENSAQLIALAHHADDQMETFFIRLIRGTTLSGLHGMSEIDGAYLRPLLNISKNKILEYLKAHNINYVTDVTNESDIYLRNRIRKYVIPALQACDNRFDESFQKTINALKQEDEFLVVLTQDVFMSLFPFNKEQSKYLCNIAAFKQTHVVLQKRLIIHWFIAEKVSFTISSALIDETLRFVLNPHGGKHVLNNAWALHKKNNVMWIEKGASRII